MTKIPPQKVTVYIKLISMLKLHHFEAYLSHFISSMSIAAYLSNMNSDSLSVKWEQYLSTLQGQNIKLGHIYYFCV